MTNSADDLDLDEMRRANEILGWLEAWRAAGKVAFLGRMHPAKLTRLAWAMVRADVRTERDAEIALTEEIRRSQIAREVREREAERIQAKREQQRRESDFEAARKMQQRELDVERAQAHADATRARNLADAGIDQNERNAMAAFRKNFTTPQGIAK